MVNQSPSKRRTFVRSFVRLRRTDGRTKRRVSSSVRPSVRSCVRLSLCPLCLSLASILWGERTAMRHKNLGGLKIWDQPYTKFGQLIIRKIIKIIATRCRILRLICTQFQTVMMNGNSKTIITCDFRFPV